MGSIFSEPLAFQQRATIIRDFTLFLPCIDRGNDFVWWQVVKECCLTRVIQSLGDRIPYFNSCTFLVHKLPLSPANARLLMFSLLETLETALGMRESVNFDIVAHSHLICFSSTRPSDSPSLSRSSKTFSSSFWMLHTSCLFHLSVEALKFNFFDGHKKMRY